MFSFGLLLVPPIHAVAYHSTFRLAAHDVDRLQRIPTNQEIKLLEKRVVTLVNQVRTKFNLGLLAQRDELCKIAKVHSINMAAKKVEFGHEGFNTRARSIFKLSRHNSFGENVAYTYLVEDPILVSLEGWMKSQGHRENILGSFDETGVGIAYSKEGRCYITQLFAQTVCD